MRLTKRATSLKRAVHAQSRLPHHVMYDGGCQILWGKSAARLRSQVVWAGSMAKPFWQRAGSWQSCHPIRETLRTNPSWSTHAQPSFCFGKEGSGWCERPPRGSYACFARRELTFRLGLFGLSNNPETVLTLPGTETSVPFHNIVCTYPALICILTIMGTFHANRAMAALAQAIMRAIRRVPHVLGILEAHALLHAARTDLGTTTLNITGNSAEERAARPRSQHLLVNKHRPMPAVDQPNTPPHTFHLRC